MFLAWGWSRTLAPGKQKVADDFDLMCLTMESPTISVSGRGGSELRTGAGNCCCAEAVCVTGMPSLGPETDPACILLDGG